MSDFAAALSFTLKWEGGYVNDPADPGGATNKGITQRTYDAWRTGLKLPCQPVKTISDTEVQKIYEGSYWASVHGPELPDPVAMVAFDIGVNMGVKRSVTLMQAASGASADGVWGPNTKKAVLAQDPVEFAAELCDAREKYYRNLAAQKPTLGKFLKGWLNRTNDLRKVAGLTGSLSFGLEEEEVGEICMRLEDLP